jgi:DNA-binding NarL/FixJ family response regulator
MQMQSRRIILVNGSRFLHEMLKRVIEKTPDLQVVDEVADLTRLSPAIAHTDAQWVIMSLPLDGEIPEVVRSLLIAHPSVRILAMATDGSQVRIKWLESHEEALDDLSLDELIAVLRTQSPWGLAKRP